MSASVTIDIAVTGGDWQNVLPDAEQLTRQAARAAWQAGRDANSHAAHEEISIVLTDDAAIRALNRDHRGQDVPTNVLSFGIAPDVSEGGQPRLLGDVVLACETVSREAAAQDKSVADHFRHLVVHGVLHLRGYDHDTEEEAAIMEQIETRLLADFGITDPYRIVETVI